MTDRQDSQFDALMSEHLASKLDSQLGRSSSRFLREVATGALPQLRLVEPPVAVQPPPHRGLRLFAFSAGIAGAAVAAGVAVVMVLAPMLSQRRAPELANGTGIARNDASASLADPVVGIDTQPQDVEHAVTWNTVDQGTVYVDGDMPLRSVVRQANETVRWYDPQRKAHMEMTVPRDEVMLVGYQSQ